jgi:tight adherence protein B
MHASLPLIIFALFAAVSLGLLTLFLFVRDLFTRPYDLDGQLGVDPQLERELIAAALAPPPTGRIDKAFHRLIDESGTRHSVGSALALVAGAAVIGAAGPVLFLDNLPIALTGTIAAAMLPLLWWSFWRWRRLKAMRKHLPQALDVVADAVRGGQNLESAVAMAGQETPGPLAEEFSYAAKQLELGQSPNAVLDRMVRRIPLPEFRIFATAVLVHERAGGNLSQLTERLARAARDRQEFMGHLNAVTAGSKSSASGPVVGGLIPVFRSRYRQAEERRLEAEALRKS